MKLRCLGTLALEGATFARPKPLTLIAYLALEGRRSRRDLGTLFWPDAADPRNRLSVVLHRVEREAPGVLVPIGDDVEARVACDVHALDAALERGDVAAARAAYGGPFLGGVRVVGVSTDLEAWIRETSEAIADRLRDAILRDAWRAATEYRFEAAAAAVDAAVAVQGATALAPDVLARAHAVALAGDGASLRALTREAAELDLPVASTPAEARARVAPGVGSGRLPRRVTSLVGRHRERVELAPRVGEDGRPIVTLLGPGGIGKTRLALAIARDRLADGAFPGGVWFVPLASVGRADEVGYAVAATLGVEPRGDEDPLSAVARRVGSQRTLVVLDNLDHVTDVGPELAAWVAACPQLFLLTTSRRRLEIEEESTFAVRGLTVPNRVASHADRAATDAVRLFVDRARRARLDFEPDGEELRAIAAICRACDGAPLAIELAAVAVRDRSPNEIARDLMDGADAGDSPSRTLAERHRSLRRSFAYSWDALPTPERGVLARIGAFRGGFAPAAACAVAGADEAILARLADRSLLESDDATRYDLHPVLAPFVRERLDADPAADGVRARHARYFAEVATRERERLRAGDAADALATFERERANLAQAAAWGVEHDPALALELAFDRIGAWRYTGRIREGREQAEAACAVADDAPPRARVGGLVAAGAMAYRAGAFDAARDRLYEALNAVPAGAGPGGDRGAWRVLGDVEHEAGRYDAAADAFEKALAGAEAAGDEAEILASATGVGRTAAVRGDLVSAERHLGLALDVARRRGSPTGLATAHYNVGALAHDAGRLEEAERQIERALALDASVGDRWGVAASLRQLGAIALERGDIAHGSARYREAVEACRALGDAAGEGDAHVALGLVALRGRDLADSLAHLRKALACATRARQAVLGARVAWALARWADAADRPELAARLWGAEAALREEGGVQVRAREAEAHARDLAETRARMGEAAFAREAALGASRALSDLAADLDAQTPSPADGTLR